MNQTGGNGEKPHFGPNLHPLGPNSGPHFFLFFFKNVASSVPRYHDQLSSCTTSEKTKDPNFSDRRTDEQTDG